MSNEQEIWKDIPNFEGLYQLSSLKRVRNVITGYIKTTRSNSTHGFSVGLSKNGKVTGLTIEKCYRELFGFDKLKFKIPDLEGEIWKDVIGYEGFYQVSNLTRIKSLTHTTIGKDNCERIYIGKILSPYISNNKTGRNIYPRVMLQKNGQSKTFLVHRLVAMMWIANPENKSEVNHIDGNKLNYSISNLEWSTAKENVQHAFRTGLNKVPKGEKHPVARLKNYQVLEIKARLENGESQREIAKYYNVSQTAIWRINKDKTYQI